MGQQYAEQAVQVVARIQPQAAQQLWQPALATVYRDHAEDGDDDGQHQGEAEQLEQQGSAGKRRRARARATGMASPRLSKVESRACPRLKPSTWRR